MIKPLTLTTLALLCGLASAPALAQRITLGPTATPAPSATRSADFIVALVDGQPVTNHEVRQRVAQLEERLSQERRSLPREELARRALEQLIAERAALAIARQQAGRVDPAMLDQAEQTVAAQNGLSVAVFRERMAAQGTSVAKLREDLRDQILLQRLREREVNQRVRVSDADVEAYLREAAAAQAPSAWQLGHILVAVPEGASGELLRAAEARAQGIARQARSGSDFAALARTESQGPERAQGGNMGMRPAERLPELFVQAVQGMPVGAVAGPVRSAAGFHILKVLDQQSSDALAVVETRARHILLRPDARLSEQQAVQRLAQWRAQLRAGTANFEALARQHSQDGSAPQGGDLGWARPGMFVPEFEQVMNQLRPGEVSEPLVSRFGVHLIRVDERRRAALSPEEARAAARAELREIQADQALEAWLQDVRNAAFVEMREAPRL
jgi:peptidyl-prolyl cis-trans isomerase SurA